ncbi:MAG TPA: M20/M25/M40 family metallo-hydrolase [Terriglobales bacterium]|nr:M20/M25/M40 family metallo-hydrolase [Terriglobales bacterium]
MFRSLLGCSRTIIGYPRYVDPFQLTRALIDIESISGNEAAVGEFLLRELKSLGFLTARMPVDDAASRFNVLAFVPERPNPEVIFSTHIDTVPPFIPSSEDETRIYGRGACDTKGIIAAMISAALRFKEEKASVGLMFVVGEERDSLGARTANASTLINPKPRFLINGEPTENKIAIASKGALRVEITARGKMAHSAYPHLGESAVEKLLEALNRIKTVKLPTDPEIGPTTVNIGVIEGGRAPNVIPDFAKAQLLYRTVGPVDKLKQDLKDAVGDLAEMECVLDIPFVRLRTFEGLPTFVAAYTTDIPALSTWGEPILFGPGSIHVAHTSGEFIEKQQLTEAIEIYYSMAKKLLAT